LRRRIARGEPIKTGLDLGCSPAIPQVGQPVVEGPRFDEFDHVQTMVYSPDVSTMVCSRVGGHGEVFCAGSCEWLAGLAHGDFTTEQVTRNVLSRFLDKEGEAALGGSSGAFSCVTDATTRGFRANRSDDDHHRPTLHGIGTAPPLSTLAVAANNLSRLHD
jgi:hypothetical protein